jgi:polyhydroxyalkanoate synthesis regulator phasin
MARWCLVLLVCCFALASGLRARGELLGNCAQRLERSMARSVHSPKSKSSKEGPRPPYFEAYGYARDTENRLADQIAIGLSTFKSIAKEAKKLSEKISKESKELSEKTSKESKELSEKISKENKELWEKTSKEYKEIMQRQNLLGFLGFALLAIFASIQPELRGFISFFLSKIKLG